MLPRKAKIRPDEPGREKVLAAGLELFGERGYDATSIAEIGERAGIAKSVLYHYFGSKAKLYEAIVEAETRELLERVAAAVPSDPNESRLRVGIEAYLAFLEERPATWRLFLRDRPAEPQLLGVYERFAAARAEGLTALLASKDKRRNAPSHLGLVATGIRAFATWWYDHRETPLEAVADAIVEFALAGAEPLADAPKATGRRTRAPRRSA